MKSIISNEPVCIVCGTTQDLHRHHIFYGLPNRKKSETWGCWCYLCAAHHNFSNEGVHYNRKLDQSLKESCQAEWEKRFGSREDFIKTFGRSWI